MYPLLGDSQKNPLLPCKYLFLPSQSSLLFSPSMAVGARPGSSPSSLIGTEEQIGPPARARLLTTSQLLIPVKREPRLPKGPINFESTTHYKCLDLSLYHFQHLTYTLKFSLLDLSNKIEFCLCATG